MSSSPSTSSTSSTRYSTSSTQGTSSQFNNRVDYPRRTHQEEYASEVTPQAGYTGARTVRSDDKAQSSTESTSGRTAGYVGVALGIASMFMWSIILGPIAAILGFYAYSQGKRTSGAWAAGLGIIATLSYFVLIPFTR
ncbi:hypothetical protein [Paenibacillus zeisoli]|uniref:hypothetical protein n=1 Tax=Paenibacillus zeisoli TaxID=2496267 RepID=UPI003CCC7323